MRVVSEINEVRRAARLRRDKPLKPNNESITVFPNIRFSTEMRIRFYLNTCLMNLMKIAKVSESEI